MRGDTGRVGAPGRPGVPAQPTPLIGRTRDLEAVRQRLRCAGVRLLTLTGPGGVGKTRLALAAAAAAAVMATPEGFTDGAWLVDLAPLRDPGLVVPAVARALGVRQVTGRPLLESLCDHLRDRRALLVLDNCEHVLPAAPQVARLREEMDAAAYTERTGCPLHTSYVPGRLRWLAETDPETFRACARFVSPGEYLFGRLFGQEKVTCSVSMASASGLMHQARGAWDEETLERLPGVRPDHLSPIGDDPVSGLLSPHHGALPVLADVPWFPALGDGACSNLGCGATGPERLALMIGTSGALRVVVGPEMPSVPAGLWRYQADAGRTLLGGALSNGGNVWAWLTETLRLPDRSAAELDAALGALPPDGHGLTVLPFLNGERAPGWRDDARAVVVGLSAVTTPLDIARAHLEAVAYRFAAVRDRLPAAGGGAEIIGTGVGLRASPAWVQILADVLGAPITVTAEEQASSRGAALWVRERLGLGKIDTAHFPVETRCEPDRERATPYREARARHEALYRSWIVGD